MGKFIIMFPYGVSVFCLSCNFLFFPEIGMMFYAVSALTYLLVFAWFPLDWAGVVGLVYFRPFPEIYFKGFALCLSSDNFNNFKLGGCLINYSDLLGHQVLIFF